MNRVASWLCGLVLAVAGGMIPAMAQDKTAEEPLALLAATQVDSSGIFLSQVFPEGSIVPTNVLLAPAPAVGQTLTVTRKEIAEILLRWAPGQGLTNWSGSDRIRITRRVRRLEEMELKDLLTAALQRDHVRDKGELELRLGRPWTSISIADEPLVLKVLDLPNAGVTPNFIVRFELRTEKEAFGPWQLPVQARVWHDVCVARSPQPRGRLLSDADIGTERRDVLLLRDALSLPDLAVPGIELAENLSTGAPVLLRSVRRRPIIRRGKTLDAIVEEGSLVISVKVEALEDGLPGQYIRVRNAKSKREFSAKVQNEETVNVAL